MAQFIDPNNFAAYDNIQILQAAATATGAGNTMKIRGMQGALINVSGITTATITVTATDVNANTSNLTVTNIATGAQSATITANGIYSVEFVGMVSLIANITAYTSGTINVFAAPATVSEQPNEKLGAAFVNFEGQVPTYSAAINAHAPAATPTDWFTIQGSATKIIRITRLTIALRATAASQYRVSLIKYSAFLTGGTAAVPTIVPHDSANPAATAVVNTWAGGLPTPGTAVGKIADDSLPVGVLGTPTFNNESPLLYDFGIRNGQSVVLRGIAQYLAINSNGVALPSGLVADVRVEFTEE